ncbi:histidine phosphatase family protein [Solibacillus sp. CAU 1738]|uniref:histidine phosphatase family protein n=1 Tax=Solibacillus sp. CAU 1738 TaxID=3140363 RepID=UPI0032609CB0
MKLFLIRHGQSEADLLQVHEGRADFNLTELGVQQANKLATFIANKYDIDLIISSPLKRAYQTAEILQLQCQCDFEIEADLMEYNNGVLAGLPRKEALVKYPLPEGGRPLHVAIKDGESMLQFRYRVENAVHMILSQYKHLETIAIVAHGGTINNLLNILLGKTLVDNHIFYTGDTGHHLLELRSNETRIHYLNSLEHLTSLI